MTSLVRRAACAAVLVLLLGGCGYRYMRSYMAPAGKLQNLSVIAVLPFENLTDHPNAGEIVADLVSTELYALERYKVIDAQTALKQYLDAGGVPQPAADRVFAQQVGAKIRADAVLYGSVQEYVYRLDKTRLGPREPAVSFTLRMVDTTTGVVIWASSISLSSDMIFSEERDPINRVAQVAVQKLCAMLKKHLESSVG